jgi:hypothetical protein
MSSKNSIESVRYHLKKSGSNASNATISSYIERHPSAAPKELADMIMAGETTALEPAAPAAPAPAALAVAQKQELAVKTIAAKEFSLALTTNDVADIVNALNPAISDELEFLAQVKGAIALWLQDRREKTSAAINKELADISDLINQDNVNISSIFDTANSQIKELVSRQKTRHTDFKSRDRRDIFELLKPA